MVGVTLWSPLLCTAPNPFFTDTCENITFRILGNAVVKNGPLGMRSLKMALLEQNSDSCSFRVILNNWICACDSFWGLTLVILRVGILEERVG